MLVEKVEAIKMKIRHDKEFDPFAGIRNANQLTIDVELYDQDADSTRSKFYFNGEFKGYGIEDEYREVKVHGETRIPNGSYEVGFRYSPKFSHQYYRDSEGNLLHYKKRNTKELEKKYSVAHELIWVKDVPGFEFILWHWGNTDDNTDGCYLVGVEPTILGGQKAVSDSRKKYMEIYPIVWSAFHKENKIVRINYNR